MRCLLIPLLLGLFTPGLVAQTSAKEVYGQVEALQQDPVKSADKEGLAKMARAALEQHAKLLAEGDGIHYRARIQQVAGAEWKDVLGTYLAHVGAATDSPLANDSLVLAAQIVHGRKGDWAGAQELLAKVKPDQLAEGLRPTYESLVRWVASDGAQAALKGGPAPDFRALKVLNGPAEFSLSDLRGKVVLLDFWATW